MLRTVLRGGEKFVFLFALIALYCDSARADKSQFHLFNPTPRDQMREMSTDRPDTTESAYTVDAGHFQLEMSFFDLSHDREGGVSTDTLVIDPLNIKVGVTNYSDLQFVFDPYVYEDIDDVGEADGAGDMQLRWKVNMWGNDEGPTALAVMPFLKFPIGNDEIGNNYLEGGIIVPFAFELPGGLGGAVMAEFDFLHEDDDDGYKTDFVHTATVGSDLIGDLGGFVEYVGIESSESDEDYIAVLDLGLTYSYSDDLIFDAGVNIGLNDAATDIGGFVGMSVRV